MNLYLFTVLSELSYLFQVLAVISLLISGILNIVYILYVMDYSLDEIKDSMVLAYKRIMLTTIIILTINTLLPSKEALELMLIQ